MSFLNSLQWLSERKWITGGFGLTLVLFSTVSLVSYQNAVQLAESARRVRQTNIVIRSLNDLSSTLTNAETGRRGYILFGDPDELERYQTSVSILKVQIGQLREVLSNTHVQESRVDRLEMLIGRRIELFQRSIEMYSKRIIVLPSQDPLIAEIKQNRMEVRQLIDRLASEEEAILESEIEQSRQRFRVRMLIEIVGTFLTFLVLFGVYILLYYQLEKRQKAESAQRFLAQEKELSDLKLQFFSMISHEFRTPLSLIIGSTQLLEERTRSLIDVQSTKNLRRIQTSANSMAQILNDMLMLARADAGKQEFNPTLVEMQSFCLNLVEDLQALSNHRRDIKFIQQGEKTHAWADEKLLHSILSNLLLNSIKYSPPDSSIYFTLISESDATIFQVKDEGIGIPAQAQIGLYEPFTRADNTEGVQGTGLGLAVVRKCVLLHQGEITCESQVGLGTTFTIKIPQLKIS